MSLPGSYTTQGGTNPSRAPNARQSYCRIRDLSLFRRVHVVMESGLSRISARTGPESRGDLSQVPFETTPTVIFNIEGDHVPGVGKIANGSPLNAAQKA